MKRTAVIIFSVSLLTIIAFAWYESLPQPHAPSAAATYWTEYVLTKSGNHTQLQSIHSDGGETTEQVIWLNFDNKTAVYHYFGCTPAEPGCTVDGCPFMVLNNTVSEYRVKVVCPPGV
jgi:hypothetical protein